MNLCSREGFVGMNLCNREDVGMNLCNREDVGMNLCSREGFVGMNL
jgi:hypothetical protein